MHTPPARTLLNSMHQALHEADMETFGVNRIIIAMNNNYSTWIERHHKILN